MFSTRLNPTKPTAAQRAVLERVGAACRAVRLEQDAGRLGARPMDRVEQFLAEGGVFSVGVPVEFGGAGDEPFLVALAAERIGREGLVPVGVFLSHLVAAATIARVGTKEQKDQYLRGAAAGSVRLSGHTLREMESSSGKMRTDVGPNKDSEDLAVPTAAILTFRLASAAGCVGMLADSIEVLAEVTAAKIRREDVPEGHRQVDRFFAETASDLEAGRAIVYAAAELKAEYDRRPTSKHLELEATTLVNESYLFAQSAIERMLARAAETLLGDSGRVLDHLPPRHDLAWPVTNIRDDGPESLKNDIASYYLFL